MDLIQRDEVPEIRIFTNFYNFFIGCGDRVGTKQF